MTDQPPNTGFFIPAGCIGMAVCSEGHVVTGIVQESTGLGLTINVKTPDPEQILLVYVPWVSLILFRAEFRVRKPANPGERGVSGE